MAGTPKLTTYRFRVWFGDPEDPDNATEMLVHGVGRDIQKTEEFFATNKWGDTQSRPMTAAAVTAWHGLQRSGRFTGTWEEFENSYLAVEPVEQVVSTPTGAVPAPA